MDFTMTQPQGNQGLRALDPDLPFLAAEVAIDVDNLLAGRSDDRAAMLRFAAILSQSTEIDPSSALPRSRMDMATLTILGEAVSETIEGTSLKKIEDLLVRASRIASVLENGDPQRDKDELEQAGNFCVALSQAAAAYSESIRDLRPSHPFKR